jgi:hypothetical protein
VPEKISLQELQEQLREEAIIEGQTTETVREEEDEENSDNDEMDVEYITTEPDVCRVQTFDDAIKVSRDLLKFLTQKEDNLADGFLPVVQGLDEAKWQHIKSNSAGILHTNRRLTK